jgi:hypothetical protein
MGINNIPPNNKKCDLCGRSALGFAVFECVFQVENELDLRQRAILPIGWRCFEHRKVAYSYERWEKASQEFTRRDPEKRIPKEIRADISKLREDEVETLYQLLQSSAVSREREEVTLDIPVEYRKMSN